MVFVWGYSDILIIYLVSPNQKTLTIHILSLSNHFNQFRSKNISNYYWKIQSELTPRANVSLTPENFLFLTP